MKAAGGLLRRACGGPGAVLRPVSPSHAVQLSMQMCRISTAESDRFPGQSALHFDVLFIQAHARLGRILRRRFVFRRRLVCRRRNS